MRKHILILIAISICLVIPFSSGITCIGTEYESPDFASGGYCYSGCSGTFCTNIEEASLPGASGDFSSGACGWGAGWYCSGNALMPEFAPIPGLLTFLGSLSLPWWLRWKSRKNRD